MKIHDLFLKPLIVPSTASSKPTTPAISRRNSRSMWLLAM